MILIAIGSNLPAPGLASPQATCDAAVARLAADPDIVVGDRSRWYESEPVPISDQPWYVNGVLRVETVLDATALLERLHAVEALFGRVRRVRNEARPLDLDLIDHDGLVLDGSAGPPVLPHPRLRERAFVLLPLADVAPNWRHPATGEGIAALLAALPVGGARIRPLDPVSTSRIWRVD